MSPPSQVRTVDHPGLQRSIEAHEPAQPAKNADDPTAWRSDEHHEDPDEIPHDVVGILALSIIFLAIITAVLWVKVSPVAAVIFGVLGSIWGMARLTRRAHRERRQEQVMPKDLIERAPPPGGGGSWPPPPPSA